MTKNNSASEFTSPDYLEFVTKKKGWNSQDKFTSSYSKLAPESKAGLFYDYYYGLGEGRKTELLKNAQENGLEVKTIPMSEINRDQEAAAAIQKFNLGNVQDDDHVQRPPSASPSLNYPTSVPSNTPTNTPTNQPSSIFSFYPTIAATNTPTDQPSPVFSFFNPTSLPSSKNDSDDFYGNFNPSSAPSSAPFAKIGGGHNDPLLSNNDIIKVGIAAGVFMICAVGAAAYFVCCRKGREQVRDASLGDEETGNAANRRRPSVTRLDGIHMTASTPTGGAGSEIDEKSSSDDELGVVTIRGLVKPKSSDNRAGFTNLRSSKPSTQNHL